MKTKKHELMLQAHETIMEAIRTVLYDETYKSLTDEELHIIFFRAASRCDTESMYYLHRSQQWTKKGQ